MFRPWLALLLCLFASLGTAQDSRPGVEVFVPEGEAKGVRQVKVLFATVMVPFGEPTAVQPFDVECSEPGKGRWVDGRNWVYEFERDLPGGIRCAFRTKAELKDLDGQALAEARHEFSTGGPAIVESMPWDGEEGIDENQVFVLSLDTPLREATVAKNVWCDVQGRGERTAVRLLTGKDKKAILDRQREFVVRTARAAFERAEADTVVRTKAYDRLPAVLLQCRGRLPAEAEVRLVWGPGIESASGVATSQEQALTFKVRPAFVAKFSCQRTRAKGNCIPVLPMALNFTAPIAVSAAERIVLKPAGGEPLKVVIGDDERRGGMTERVTFDAPFAEGMTYSLSLPDGLVDDAGRALANAKRFPLTVKTDPAPPLVKFAARFGILEWKAEPALPLTVRSVEKSLAGKQVAVTGPATAKGLPARLLRVQSPREILHWLKRLDEDGEARWSDQGYISRSVFGNADATKALTVPRPGGEKDFEVIGIPLPDPGFYVVEVVSPKLGQALLKDGKPYYVSSGALVTNLAVHFKWGRESSLVWVTTLDKGEPAAGADVAVLDCSGKALFEGKADRQGIARISRTFPRGDALAPCRGSWDRRLFITARLGPDATFAFSDWNDGIETWRFRLPRGDGEGPERLVTVFDRTLLRAGDTVSMKHFARRQTSGGFAFSPAGSLPTRAVIRHIGTWQTWEMPLSWGAGGHAESTWAIPKDAKLGEYEVVLAGPKTKDETEGSVTGQRGGSFRVEAFRLPALRADIQLPAAPLVDAQALDVGVQLSYLSGGGAGGQKVRLRALTQPRQVLFEDFDGYVFANGDVRESTPVVAGDLPVSATESSDEDVAEGEDDSRRSADVRTLKMQALTLDAGGAGKPRLEDLPRTDKPRELLVELEYADPNGQISTRAARTTLWPSKILLGVRPDGWALSKEKVKLQIAAVDAAGRPQTGVRVTVDLFERQSYSHRKRLVGGFYAYEYGDSLKRIGEFCTGDTDTRGVVACDAPVAQSGNVVFRARATDADGKVAVAHADAWVAGSGEWWFEVGNDDRMDVLPEKPRYEPGESAVVQVRAPFRKATALVTVEREGILDAFVTTLSGKAPVVKVPLAGNYAPNAFISVLAVRGRVAGVQPTALVDLGRPAFRLGVTNVRVGWKAHTLQVKVTPERGVYRTREKARVAIQVERADGKALPKGAEVAVAAVDEALLDLMPNTSWQLLEAMMHPRGIDVETSTAVSQVIGRRHFGKKALAPGGGGGRQVSRELFDTLLLWRGRVKLDANGRAEVDVPINDSLTSFRIVAIASAGAGLFGTGSTSVRSAQDLQLISGLPPVVRETDRYTATFTVRNASARAMEVELEAAFAPVGGKSGAVTLEKRPVSLAAGEAANVSWTVTVPASTSALQWTASAREVAAEGGAADSMKVSQKVGVAVPVQVVQATLARIDGSLTMPVAPPAAAISGKGELRVNLTPQLGNGLTGVRDYMGAYPYSCLEQRVSKAVALRDSAQWRSIVGTMPGYLDRNGLAKYFPSMAEGSEVLSAYVLAISHEAGWDLPENVSASLKRGLGDFVAGRLSRPGIYPAADLAIRKIAALDALTRHGETVDPAVLSTFELRPDLWPTSAVIDWLAIAQRWDAMPDREKHAKQAENILRTRLDLQGTRLGFSTEQRDALWWLMVSGDVNANRMLLAVLDHPRWKEDLPRLARGSWLRQKRGHWDTTVANAWGTLAMEKFSQRFESQPVAGATTGVLGDAARKHVWRGTDDGASMSFEWPAQTRDLKLTHEGGGTPWATVQSRAAIPRTEPYESGYRIRKTVTVIDGGGGLSIGNVVRVRLDLEAQADMTWVVVDDPVPAGATILGSGLGNDSEMLKGRSSSDGALWTAFEERAFDAFRSYYVYVPKGSWRIEYNLRLNTPGQFHLPATRVEAMYAPEMFGEFPNANVVVGK